MENQIIETGCCKKFDPQPWDEKEITWQEKLFVKDRVKSLFHIPLNFGKMVIKNMTKMEKAGAVGEQLMLVDENSLWGADAYIAVNKEVPDAQMEKISGTFLTKVFEGPYKDARKWLKQMDEFAKNRNFEYSRIYFSYTTCPACAKAYGKNYVILFAKKK
ncbi:MAG: hypothetical protein PHQ47_01395 [Candidatus Portnoybacteria bacterium]|nr:hypothetical protein [Candidatus Portnoybacteria bacterium]